MQRNIFTLIVMRLFARIVEKIKPIHVKLRFFTDIVAYAEYNIGAELTK